jgi:flagellar motility protein MotE (MotC chaperone)
MKRVNQVFLGCVIVMKIGLALLLLCWQGGQALFLQKQAMASQDGQGIEKSFQNQAGTGDAELAELKAVLRIKKEIEEEKERIRQERMEMLAMQEDLERKLVDLSRLRDEIRAQMETRKFADEQRMKHLVKAYSSMKPQIAAALIEKLELPFAVEMLSRMQGSTVGSILSFVDKERAAKICQGLVKPR